MRLQDKIAYISGGGSGIGAACAELFASEGARVALADLHHDKAKTVADRLAGQHFAGAVDVTSEDSLRTSLDAAEAALGPLDILVNCAGITLRNVPAGTNWVESWQMVMDVNVKGTMLASTLFCERAIAAKTPRRNRHAQFHLWSGGSPFGAKHARRSVSTFEGRSNSNNP